MIRPVWTAPCRLRTAHRMGGAIDFAIAYAPGHLTRRLTGWRSEYGGDAFWVERLGRRVAGLGWHGLWREMAARPDRLVG